MTEQPDTTAIRECWTWPRAVPVTGRWTAWTPAPMAPGGTILALCDALDAARAKEFHHRELIGHLKGRAEAAEARIAELEAREVCNDNGPCTCNWRAVTAEARITAALAWFDRADCTWTYRVEMARRALTEGTERGVLPE